MNNNKKRKFNWNNLTRKGHSFFVQRAFVGYNTIKFIRVPTIIVL